MDHRKNKQVERYKLTKLDISILSIIDFYESLSMREISKYTQTDISYLHKKIDKLINYKLLYKIDYDEPAKYTRLQDE